MTGFIRAISIFTLAIAFVACTLTASHAASPEIQVEAKTQLDKAGQAQVDQLKKKIQTATKDEPRPLKWRIKIVIVVEPVP